MPKYVTRMAKSGESESYAVKDSGARELIASETSARESAVAAEASAREAAVSAEATARANAVSAEATARANAVSAEATAREAAIQSLRNDINETKLNEDVQYVCRLRAWSENSGFLPSNNRLSTVAVQHYPVDVYIDANDVTEYIAACLVLWFSDYGPTTEHYTGYTAYDIGLNGRNIIKIPADTYWCISLSQSSNRDFESQSVAEKLKLSFVPFVDKGLDISGAAADAKAVGERLNKIENDQENLPDYYYENDYLPEKLLDIRKKMVSANGMSFAFITDTHFPINGGNSKNLLAEVFNSTPVPFCVFGGDAIGSLYGDEAYLDENIGTLISYNSKIGETNWFSLVGNHDLYSREQGEPPYVYHRLNLKEIFNVMMRKSERFVTNMNTDHLCYCIDIPVQKTRFIMLNSTDMAVPNGSIVYTDAQIRWLIDALKELNNTNIIVMAHCSSDPVIADTEAEFVEKVQDVLIAFKAKGSVEIGGVTYSFSETTNTLIAQISGHTHSDVAHMDQGVFSIATTCDAAYTEDGEGMVLGTITEQAFDVFFIDYDNKTIKTTRIGRGSDRAWNYETGNTI